MACRRMACSRTPTAKRPRSLACGGALNGALGGALERALTYPFVVASRPFVWTARGSRQLGHPELGHREVGRPELGHPEAAHLQRGDGEPDLIHDRIPVLAYGSNAAPSQLDRKFADQRFSDPATPDGFIPVLRATVPDVDVAYSAHLAGYGSVPATLCRRPGTLLTTFVSWLTPRQQERMDETEGMGSAYELRRLPGVQWEPPPRAGRVRNPPTAEPGPVLAYVSTRGCACVAGELLGVAELSAPKGGLRRIDQRQLWDRLAVATEQSGDGAMLCARVLADDRTRRAVDALLAATAVGHAL